MDQFLPKAAVCQDHDVCNTAVPCSSLRLTLGPLGGAGCQRRSEWTINGQYRSDLGHSTLAMGHRVVHPPASIHETNHAID